MCTFPLQCSHGFLKNTPDVYIGNHMQSIPSKRIICKVFSAWLAYVLKLNSSNGVDHQHINGTFCFFVCEFCEIFHLANPLNMLLTCLVMVQSQ